MTINYNTNRFCSICSCVPCTCVRPTSVSIELTEIECREALDLWRRVRDWGVPFGKDVQAVIHKIKNALREIRDRG